MNPPLFSLIFLLLNIILCSSSFLTKAADSKAEEEYSYEEGSEHGPENWGHINPAWSVCGSGKSQSPIDIKEEEVEVSTQLCKLETSYTPAPALLKNRGHDVALEWNGDAGKININGTAYTLLQCHWHSPSEHTLDGSKFDLEMHAVHQNSKGELAVVGVWYKIGKPDTLLSKLLPHIKSLGDKDIDVGTINPREMRFERKKYFRYSGSLTTPPCTEGVTWTLVRRAKTVSSEQLSALKEAVHDGFEENARPTQKLEGRSVLFPTAGKGSTYSVSSQDVDTEEEDI